jgi:hypothetical protein
MMKSQGSPELQLDKLPTELLRALYPIAAGEPGRLVQAYLGRQLDPGK